MEAGAKAAAAPTRDKQNAVFILSIGIAIGEERSGFVSKKTLESNLRIPFGSTSYLYIISTVSLPMISPSTD